MPDSPQAVWAVAPAGGSGSRFSSSEDKLLAKLQELSVLVHTLTALLQAPSLQGIVLVSSLQNQPIYRRLLQSFLPDAPIQHAIGGATRRASVYNGLLALPPETSIALIHDAARPLIDPQLVEDTIQAVQQGAAGAIVAAPIHDTVKQVSNGSLNIKATLDRSLLWRAQTPQTFNLGLLLQAHNQTGQDVTVTDDAQLLELCGLGPVQIIPGDERNLKITTAADLILAEALLQTQPAALL